MNICSACKKEFSKYEVYWENNYKMLRICNDCMNKLLDIDKNLGNGYSLFDHERDKNIKDECFCDCHE